MNQLNFGQALDAIKAGKRIARTGWNGKDMFVYLVPPASYPVQTGAAKAHFGAGAMVPYNAYMAIKNVDGTVSTWVPSVNDCLAVDWGVVGEAAPGPVAFGDEEYVAVPRGLIGAACSAIEQKRDAQITLAELRRYTFGDKSKAISPAAPIALPVVDPGPDSLERAMESKTYQDGTTAFGPAPLPDVSPALWAKPLAKEVPELTESLSDLGLEREIQANSHHSGCKGERCMASAANGYAHSRECIDEAGEAQGWTPTAEDYAKCGPSAGCCGAAPTDSHASAVLYPAIERAMSELGTLHPGFNFAVNRAFNHLHDAFWSECPAPASAAPKRPNFPGV